MKKIILASTSPRRKELLGKIITEFQIVKPNYDESIETKEFSYKLIENIAKNKGLSVLNNINSPAIIISADTIVIYGNKILGKPKDFDEAKLMLMQLNGKTHKVVTAICVINNENNKKIIKSETSKVTFNELKEEQIENYIKKYKPYDKAGSYGIQELPAGFIKEVQGDYDNIVGFPVKLAEKILNEIEN